MPARRALRRVQGHRIERGERIHRAAGGEEVLGEHHLTARGGRRDSREVRRVGELGSETREDLVEATEVALRDVAVRLHGVAQHLGIRRLRPQREQQVPDALDECGVAPGTPDDLFELPLRIRDPSGRERCAPEEELRGRPRRT